jgi:hypothetical protein
VGEVHHAVAGSYEHGVPVALEGGPVRVVGEAIEFGDEALLRPERVDLASQ